VLSRVALILKQVLATELAILPLVGFQRPCWQRCRKRVVLVHFELDLSLQVERQPPQPVWQKILLEDRLQLVWLVRLEEAVGS
jgi:hypothetical protein